LLLLLWPLQPSSRMGCSIGDTRVLGVQQGGVCACFVVQTVLLPAADRMVSALRLHSGNAV
jgi:hypothetical protein